MPDPSVTFPNCFDARRSILTSGAICSERPFAERFASQSRFAMASFLNALQFPFRPGLHHKTCRQHIEKAILTRQRLDLFL